MQILYSLKEAHRLHGFIHGNLRPETIFVRALDEEVTIKYGDVYLTTSILALMFDFSQSRVIYDDIRYKPLPYVNLLQDAYSLLTTSLLIMKTSDNTSTFENLSSLFRFFTKEESIDEAPEIQNVDGKLDDFIEFIGINMKMNFIEKTRYSDVRLLIDSHSFESRSPSENPVDIISGDKLFLHDIYEYLYLQENVKDFGVITRTHLPSLIDNELRRYNSMIIESKKLLDINIVGLPLEKLTDKEKKLYRNYLADIMYKVELFQRIINSFKALSKGSKESGDLTTKRYLKTTKEFIAQFEQTIHIYIEAICSDRQQFIQQGDKELIQLICCGIFKDFMEFYN